MIGWQRIMGRADIGEVEFWPTEGAAAPVFDHRAECYSPGALGMGTARAMGEFDRDSIFNEMDSPCDFKGWLCNLGV